MKKTVYALGLGVMPFSLSLAMQEPLSSSTDSSANQTLKHALLDENAPLFSALVHACIAAPTCEEALKNASLATIYDIPNPRQCHKAPGLEIESYHTLAPLLIEKCGDRGAQIALIAAAGDHSLEKTQFILENYTMPQEALNKALEATFKSYYVSGEAEATLHNGVIEMLYSHGYLNYPPYNPDNKKATKENYALITLLEKYGAKLSHNTASESLKALAENWPMDDFCSETRRDAARWLIVRGGTFEKHNCMTDPKKYAAVCCDDCGRTAINPRTNLDLYRVGKPVTIGSVLGYMLASTVCLPCCAVAAARHVKELCEPEEDNPFITAPDPAVAMNPESAPQPAHLGQDV